MKKGFVGLLLGSAVVLSAPAAMAANGCAVGTYDTTVTGDGLNYSTLFDEWVAFTPTLLSTCSYSIALKDPAPSGNIVIFTSDIRGYRYLEAGDKVSLKVKRNGDQASFSDEGVEDDDFIVSDLVAVSGDKIKVEGSLKVTDTSGDALAMIDSIDFTELGRITTATDQTAMVTHLGATAGLLTGGLQPIEGDNEVAIVGGYGSYMLGATARYNLADGISLLSGVSVINQSAGASSSTGVIGAAAVRYVEPGVNTLRPLVEGGLVLGGLSTKYPNTASSVGQGLGTIYAKGGFVSDVLPATQLALYGTLSETALNTGSFTQNFTGFTVNAPAQTGFFTTAKVTAAVTTQLAPQVDLSAEASAGLIMSHSGFRATVPGLGTVNGAQNSAFVDYGVRLGYEATQQVKLELFAQGSVGQDIGAHNQVGAAVRFKF